MLQTDARYAGHSSAEARRVSEEIRRRVASIPGVQSVALARGLPMEVTGTRVVVDDGAAGTPLAAGAIWAGAGFFDTLRIPILFGRAIDERDRLDAPRVAVVNETMARQYLGTVNAVGRRFRFEQEGSGWFEVVGVARDTGTADRQGDLVDPTSQLFYRSFAQADVSPDAAIARTSADAVALAGAMQRELRAVDASLPIIAAKTMAQYLEESLVAPIAAARLLGGLGALGLMLAGIGLYAVISFRVSRRAREIGIRMALGARSAQVVRSVIGEVAVLVGVGTVAGLLVSLMTVRVLRAVSTPAPGVSLYRPTADPLTLISIAVFMAAVGVAAASIPAWRAATMDPLSALRRE